MTSFKMRMTAILYLMRTSGGDEHSLSNILPNDIRMHIVLAGKSVQHRRSQKKFLVVYWVSPAFRRPFLVKIRTNVARILWSKDMPQGVSRQAIGSLRGMDEKIHCVRHIEMQSGRSCVCIIKNRCESIIHLGT